MRITGSILKDYLYNNRFRDKWVMLSTPNTDSSELKGKRIIGVMVDGSYNESTSVETKNSVSDVGAGLLDRATQASRSVIGDSADRLSDALTKSVPDWIVYDGVSNRSRTLNFIFIPEERGNPTMNEFIEYMNKLTRPKPYSASFSKLNVLQYEPYLTELGKMEALKSSAEELKSSAISLVKEHKLDRFEWSDQFVHIHIGDNIFMTGMVLMDVDMDFDLIRDEDGQFWYAKVSVGIAPYRVPNAEVATKFITNKNKWKEV